MAERSMMKQFDHLLNEIGASYHEAALKFGLSDSALLILYTICHNGDSCLLSDITHTSGASKQTIHSALHKLEADEIVYLETLGQRKKIVSLTEKGKDFASHTVQKVLDIENEIFGSWSDEERILYIELTQRYLTSMKTKVKEL